MIRVLALAAAVAFVLGDASSAYVPTLVGTAGNLNTVSWAPGSNVTYRYHTGVASGPANVEAGSNPIAAIDAAFQTISAASGINFQSGPATSTELAERTGEAT